MQLTKIALTLFFLTLGSAADHILRQHCEDYPQNFVSARQKYLRERFADVTKQLKQIFKEEKTFGDSKDGKKKRDDFLANWEKGTAPVHVQANDKDSQKLTNYCKSLFDVIGYLTSQGTWGCSVHKKDLNGAVCSFAANYIWEILTIPEKTRHVSNDKGNKIAVQNFHYEKPKVVEAQTSGPQKKTNGKNKYAGVRNAEKRQKKPQEQPVHVEKKLFTDVELDTPEKQPEVQIQLPEEVEEVKVEQSVTQTQLTDNAPADEEIVAVEEQTEVREAQTSAHKEEADSTDEELENPADINVLPAEEGQPQLKKVKRVLVVQVTICKTCGQNPQLQQYLQSLGN